MVSEKKREGVKVLAKNLEKYPIIGLLDMFKMPGKQLHEMRDKLRGKATIMVIRKSLIRLAIEKIDKKGLKDLEALIQNQPALLLSDKDPFELARIIDSSKSFAAAKEGDIAPTDIVVKAGPTPLKPGPVIGELQRVKIPAGVEGEKIVVKKDTVVVREGEVIDRNVADIIGKLGIEPMEIGLNLVAVWDQGTIFKKDVLFIPQEKYVDDLKYAHSCAFNLAMSINYITDVTVPHLISKAQREALSLAMEANIITKETIGRLLSKANAQMFSLKGKADLSAPPAEEKPEEKIESQKKDAPKEGKTEEEGEKPKKGKNDPKGKGTKGSDKKKE
ncbi:MAG: 50S ribosomal protein L10 [Candidatus Aenigmarchaeota archaeon]|nr:50S ribosomal protein L10 [Candidatus Aenigmarchaeota archaeon]